MNSASGNGSRGLGLVGALVVIAAAVMLVGGGYFAYQRFVKPTDTGGVVCTQETKLSPDGSYISRTGPNCEFALCPSKALCEGGACSSGDSNYKNATALNQDRDF